MNNLLSQSIQSVVRHALAGVFVWLAAKGWITNDLATQLLTAIAATAAVVVWSVINKYGLLQKVDTALGMPANSTPAQLDREVASQK
jgi:hypothetical protein